MTQLELIIVFLGKAEAALVQYLNTCDCGHHAGRGSKSAIVSSKCAAEKIKL